MDNFLQKPKKEKSNKIVIVAAMAVGVVFVLVLLGLFSLKSSQQQIQTQALEGAFREGTPEFEKYTKKIVAETDFDNTQQSPTGMGTIMMSIRGKFYNFTGKTLTGLEVRVSVVDITGKPVKEREVVVLPKGEINELDNGQTMPVQVTIEGFNKDDDRANIRWKVTAIKVKE